MKKVLLSVLMIFSALLMGSHLFAEETSEGTGNLIIHYQNLTGDYTDFGLHTWDHGHKDFGGNMDAEAIKGLTKKDDFGVYWELNDLEIKDAGSFGWIIVSPNGADFWGEKHVNHEIKYEDLVIGETVHIYMFEGGNTRTNDEGLDTPIPYLVTNPKLHNVLLTYYDQSGSYPENLGIHSWGWKSVADPGWGDPAKVFENVGVDNSGVAIKAVMLTYEEGGEPGAIVYDGSTKFTGDVKIHDLVDEVAEVGKADVVQVVNAGDGNESLENVFVNDAQAYIEEAYKFTFVDMYTDEAGVLSGTFAPTPNQIMVEFNAAVAFPKENVAKEGEEEKFEVVLTDEEKENLIKTWFNLKDSSGTTIKIDSIDFNKGANSVSSFVLILGTNLDNTKEYTLNAKIDEVRDISTKVNMDDQAPVFTFLSPTDFVLETDGDKRIILVQWDKKFDQNLFPRFTVTDNRDGDITSLVHVPKGDFSVIDTNVIGDYKIMLRVQDDWGNITEETFIFRVTKKV